MHTLYILWCLISGALVGWYTPSGYFLLALVLLITFNVYLGLHF